MKKLTQGLIVLVLLVAFLSQFTMAEASTAYMDPAGDASITWSPNPNAIHYLNINKGTRQPTGASTASYNFEGADNGAAGSVQDDFTMSTAPTVTSVSQIKVWTYADRPGSGATGYQINIFVNGSWQTPTDVDGDLLFNTPTWISATYNGTFTQSDLNNLQVRLGGGSDSDQTVVKVYSMYAEITYTGASVDSVANQAFWKFADF